MTNIEFCTKWNTRQEWAEKNLTKEQYKNYISIYTERKSEVRKVIGFGNNAIFDAYLEAQENTLKEVINKKLMLSQYIQRKKLNDTGRTQ